MRDTKSGPAGPLSVGAVFAGVLLVALVAGFGWQRWQQRPAPAPEVAVNLPAASAVTVAQGPVAPAASAPAPIATATPASAGALVPTPTATASAPQRVAQAEPRPKPPREVPQPERVQQPVRPDVRPEATTNRPSEQRPHLQAWVVFAEQDISVQSERISLPTGARFALKLRTNAAGSVAMYTVNPQGVHSQGPVWEAQVTAQEPVTSPTLRLAGAQGLETMRVQFKPAAGGPSVWQTVQLLHL